MIMKRKLPRKQNAKVSLKKMEKRKIQSVVNVLARPKSPQGKPLSSFALQVENKLDQMDVLSCTITEKKIMYIIFEVEMGTTCVTTTQRQHSISMRPTEAQFLNAATPFQLQYSSGTPQAQNFWMDLLHNN